MGDSCLKRVFASSDGIYEIRPVMEHYEVFLDGVFQFSADTIYEAQQELRTWG